MTEDRVQKTEVLSRLRRGFSIKARRSRPMFCPLSSVLCLLMPVFCLLSSALASPPDSVQATYDVYKNGMRVEIRETYTRDEDRYTLSSVWTPVGLLAILKPEKIFIESSGLVDKQGLQPLLLNHRRELDKNKNSRAEFDWNNKQLTLIHQAQRTVVPLPAKTQDRLSVMYQFMFLPLQNAAALDFPMTNGEKLDNYHYAITHNQTIKVPAGEFKATHLDSQAKPGERRTEIWLATQYNNLPCKMTITEANGDQLTQVLSKLTIKP